MKYILLAYVAFFMMIAFCVWATGEFGCLFFLFFMLAFPSIDNEKNNENE